MSLYAMGDFHLAANSDRTMDRYDPIWVDHEKKIEKNCRELIRPEDTLVITGDLSQSSHLNSCREDLAFIEALPGRKILVRGNHDQFWQVKKTNALNQEFAGRLHFLQNNYMAYEDYALIGSKGYCFEGRDTLEHAELLKKREEKRLRTAFELARADGYRKFILFLHYPPTAIGEEESCFTRLAEEYGVSQVVYSHCHGALRFHDSILGEKNGIQYRLVSADFLKFRPFRLL